MTLLDRVPSSLVRVAGCAVLAAVLGLSSAPGGAAADLRVMGRLGWNIHDMNRADGLEINISQGAKPGLGGQLMAKKDTPELARIRGIPHGIDLRSPSRHPDILGGDDLLIKVEEMREATGYRLPVSVKLGAGRIEDVGVEQRRPRECYVSTAHGCPRSMGRAIGYCKPRAILIRGSQFVQRLAATGFDLATVVKDVLGADAAMCAYLPAGDPSFVEQLNQVRSRYLQEVRCLARREFRMQGGQCHTVAVRHVVQDLLEHPHCRGRDIDGFSSRDAETGADRVRPITQCRQFAACFVRENRIAVARNACRCRCVHYGSPSFCRKVDRKYRKRNI